MTGQMELVFTQRRRILQKILVREHRAMVRKGEDERSTRAKKCQCYMDELEVAEEILRNIWDITQVSFGLIQRLRQNTSDLEEKFDGVYVNVSKVKKTGVYFVALTPVEEI